MLEEEKIDIVVFRFYSGGGLLLEIQPLSDIIQSKYKKKFHSVAWIESAISAAAMTAHTFNDIYFTSQANYGACTGFAGSLDRPVVGIELEEVLAMMEKISDRGGHDTRIMRAMQISSNDDDIKDLEIGLIDFPTLFRGQEVYLCWKLGEDKIRFWHGIHEGFRGRKAIDQDFLDNHSNS